MSCATRRPCCRRELPRDAGHLYRNDLIRGNAVNRNNSKTIGKHGEVVEQVAQLSQRDRLSRAHERYRRQTDGRAIAYSEREREFTFAKITRVVYYPGT